MHIHKDTVSDSRTPRHDTAAHDRMSKRRIALIALAVLIVALVGGRIYLPYWVTDYVNRKIDALDGYGGSVKDIDIHLIRGAYQIHDLDIYKTDGGLQTPFVAAKTIDLSIEWRALLHGVIVSEIDIDTIALTFSKSQKGTEANWTDFIDDLTPFDINRLGVSGGKIAYVDPAASPQIDLHIADIQAEVTNLRNVNKKNVRLPSDVTIRGTSIGEGKLAITGSGNILKQVPDFDLDLRLENASMTSLNDFTSKAAGIDFHSGNISVYSELAAANGHITGYVKPIATQVDMVHQQQDTHILDIVWESLASAFMKLFKNHPNDQFALRIPIEGQIEQPESNMWAGFWSIFSNAFVQAFPRTTDGNIDFNHALETYREES